MLNAAAQPSDCQPEHGGAGGGGQPARGPARRRAVTLLQLRLGVSGSHWQAASGTLVPYVEEATGSGRMPMCFCSLKFKLVSRGTTAQQRLRDSEQLEITVAAAEAAAVGSPCRAAEAAAAYPRQETSEAGAGAAAARPHRP